jgi:DNA-binding winged helix-turn-helix (wHTH) protein
MKMVGMATSLKMNPTTRRWTTMPGKVDTNSQSRPVRLCIGSFELDPKSGELISERKNTLLQWQPLQLLLMLIDADGELVTRAQIQQRLWGNDVIVDYDHSINTLVRKLRRALCDSAEAPTYIETLARRGYRLKISVEMVEKPRANSETTNGSILSSITLPPVWKDWGESKPAASGQSSAVGLQHITGSTERGFVAHRTFRCRQRGPYDGQQHRDSFVPRMLGTVAARLCAKP